MSKPEGEDTCHAERPIMNIIELAKQAGWSELSLSMIQGCEDEKRLERFAALVLEEAAKVCDAGTYPLYVPAEDGAAADYYDVACQDCAAAIRTLKGAKE